ncbi:hypothetical protein [Truepera radiovictrix]|nr:hypothetical protein [Truepera radiovictrix]WMT58459.1 hypothetical protein RCV51_05820 [Truepera radiovictrix]
MSHSEDKDEQQQLEDYKRWISMLPRQFVPYYDANPNEPIMLYQDEMTLRERNGYEITSKGTLSAFWFPTPGVRFKLKADPKNPASWFIVRDPLCRLDVPGLNLSVDVFLTRMTPGIAEGLLNSPTVLGPDSDLAYLQLHIVNFVDYHGEAIAVTDTRVHTAQLTMENSGWHLTIQLVKDGRKRIERLKKEYGYAITHVAKLECRHGRALTTDEAIEATHNLNRLFSFIKGADVASVLTVGFDTSDRKVWEYWNPLFLGDNAKYPERNWFPHDQPTGLDRLFSGYMDLQADEAWSEVIDSAITWYVKSSCATSVEVAILFAQMGLELLSWASFVEVDQKISANGFEKLPNADRMTLLLSTLLIPTAIPDQLKALQAFARSKNMSSGAEVIAHLRNNIVHPNLRAKIRVLPSEAQIEAVKLCLWYLELSLLKLCGYHGTYNNRLDTSNRHMCQPVPWADT